MQMYSLVLNHIMPAPCCCHWFLDFWWIGTELQWLVTRPESKFIFAIFPQARLVHFGLHMCMLNYDHVSWETVSSRLFLDSRAES